MDEILVAKYWMARLVCGIGQWFVERGIDIAGEGSAEVWFEASLEKSLPWWMQAIGVLLGFVAFWFAIIVIFAATGRD